MCLKYISKGVSGFSDICILSKNAFYPVLGSNKKYLMHLYLRIYCMICSQFFAPWTGYLAILKKAPNYVFGRFQTSLPSSNKEVIVPVLVVLFYFHMCICLPLLCIYFHLKYHIISHRKHSVQSPQCPTGPRYYVLIFMKAIQV